MIDELDLACVCSSGASLEDLLETTGLVLGDLDADGEVGFSDFLSLSASFNSAGNYLDGDLNCDGMVEFADFLILQSSFGQSPTEYTDGDFDVDGTVGFSDFLVLSGNYGQGGDIASETAAVPEPASLVMLITFVVFMTLRRRQLVV